MASHEHFKRKVLTGALEGDRVRGGRRKVPLTPLTEESGTEHQDSVDSLLLLSYCVHLHVQSLDEGPLRSKLLQLATEAKSKAQAAQTAQRESASRSDGYARGEVEPDREEMEEFLQEFGSEGDVDGLP